jgi:hypothetical protein
VSQSQPTVGVPVVSPVPSRVTRMERRARATALASAVVAVGTEGGRPADGRGHTPDV